MSRLRTTPTTHPGGGAVALHVAPEERRYVALRHVRIGEELREPGRFLSAEELTGRNVASMLRHGEIQQIIEPDDPPRARRRQKRDGTR